MSSSTTEKSKQPVIAKQFIGIKNYFSWQESSADYTKIVCVTDNLKDAKDIINSVFAMNKSEDNNSTYYILEVIPGTIITSSVKYERDHDGKWKNVKEIYRIK